MGNRVNLQLPRVGSVPFGSFLIVWLLVGFASGTATLLGPVRWLTDAGRASDWSATTESLAVKVVIALFVVASFLVSWTLTRRAAAGGRAAWSIFGATLALAGGALWLWMTPAVVNGLVAVEVTSVARFSFGPYPDEARFASLREEGYTAVISLLHPAVVPFEPQLLAREKELAAQHGIELIHAPMLPWVSDNEGSLARIRELATSGTGRYYVHCYLGRDRVGTVRTLVGRVTEGVNMAAVAEAIRRLEARSTFVKGRFERGPIHKLAEGVYYTPYPTDEEFLTFVTSGAFHSVVSLLDPDNPADVQWIEHERGILANVAIPFALVPIAAENFDPLMIQRAVREVRTLPRPVLVHAFLSEGPVTDAFVSSFRTDLPPVSTNVFAEPMAGGDVDVLAVNILSGPRPTGPEFGNYLERHGVRGVVFVGPADHPVASDDRIVVEAETDMVWRGFEPQDPALMQLLGRGGPWYLYGPGLGVVQGQVHERFSPTLAASPLLSSPTRGQ